MYKKLHQVQKENGTKEEGNGNGMKKKDGIGARRRMGGSWSMDGGKENGKRKRELKAGLNDMEVEKEEKT